MKLGAPIQNFTQPPTPDKVLLNGDLVRLERIDVQTHGAALYEAFGLDVAGENWTYLPYGPFKDQTDYLAWFKDIAGQKDPCLFCVIDLETQKPVGVLGYLRITPSQATIEIGHVHFSPLLQRTSAATEAVYLLINWAFENGYRRVEWKCHSLNEKSRRAAQRFGFSYEGVFRQHLIVKQHNRDTAWFAMIDQEWATMKSCYERFLQKDNFDAHGNAKLRLSERTRPHLHKLDDFTAS